MYTQEFDDLLIGCLSTLYNVTVELGSAENGNVPAIHPRVIARSSFFGLPMHHSQSFKLTLVPHLFSPRTSFTFLFSTYRLFQTVQFPPVSAALIPVFHLFKLTCLKRFVLHLSFSCFPSISNRTVCTRLLPLRRPAVIAVCHHFQLASL